MSTTVSARTLVLVFASAFLPAFIAQAGIVLWRLGLVGEGPLGTASFRGSSLIFWSLHLLSFVLAAFAFRIRPLTALLLGAIYVPFGISLSLLILTVYLADKGLGP